MSARMSTTTFKMDDDEEERNRKGLRGLFRQVFKKKWLTIFTFNPYFHK